MNLNIEQKINLSKSTNEARLKRMNARNECIEDLRKAAKQTQEDLAAALGVGQDTISRLEKRSDMLLSTLRHYVESMGGKLELVAQFPNRPPVVIDHLGVERSLIPPSTSKPSRVRSRSARASA